MGVKLQVDAGVVSSDLTPAGETTKAAATRPLFFCAAQCGASEQERLPGSIAWRQLTASCRRQRRVGERVAHVGVDLHVKWGALSFYADGVT
jgi:hypothetical protein